ncbi:hypothetical protein [uncultured Flavobacterium sp.]|uniref:hypothetical protein n=1 Tax=uncultured Flavobacterium sp. TaxID=165435 RepID=UPI0030C8CCE3
MTFKVEPITSKEYHLIQSNLLKGSLVYTNWFSISKATISIKNLGDFYVAKKSTWKSDFYIMQNDSAVLEFTFNWKGTVQITSHFEKEIKKNVLKRKGFWNTDYLLIDENNTEICTIKSNFNWRKFKTSYEINVLESTDSMQDQVLYLSLIHCTILIRVMAAAAT